MLFFSCVFSPPLDGDQNMICLPGFPTKNAENSRKNRAANRIPRLARAQLRAMTKCASTCHHAYHRECLHVSMKFIMSIIMRVSIIHFWSRACLHEKFIMRFILRISISRFITCVVMRVIMRITNDCVSWNRSGSGQLGTAWSSMTQP